MTLAEAITGEAYPITIDKPVFDRVMRLLTAIEVEMEAA